MRQRPRQVACGPHRFLARMTRVFSAAAQISDGGHGNLMSIDRFSSHRHAKSPARDQALTCAELSAQRICGALTGCPLRGSGRMRRPATRSRWPARPGRSSGARADGVALPGPASPAGGRRAGRPGSGLRRWSPGGWRPLPAPTRPGGVPVRAQARVSAIHTSSPVTRAAGVPASSARPIMRRASFGVVANTVPCEVRL